MNIVILLLVVVLGMLTLWYINDYKKIAVARYNSFIRLIKGLSDETLRIKSLSEETPLILSIKIIVNSYAIQILKQISASEIIYLMVLYITVSNILQIIHIVLPEIQPYVIITQSISLILFQYICIMYGFRKVWSYRRNIDTIDSKVTVNEVQND
jgi:hypothetical protein